MLHSTKLCSQGSSSQGHVVPIVWLWYLISRLGYVPEFWLLLDSNKGGVTLMRRRQGSPHSFDCDQYWISASFSWHRSGIFVYAASTFFSSFPLWFLHSLFTGNYKSNDNWYFTNSLFHISLNFHVTFWILKSISSHPFVILWSRISRWPCGYVVM